MNTCTMTLKISCATSFQGKSFIHNISASSNEVETKIGAWTDFIALNIFK